MGRFEPLSDLDFEELVADLLRADTGLPYRAGVRGRDRGIDVLAVRGRRRHVVQCKHLRTGDARVAVREAKKEARALADRRPRWASYRFVTSMRLSHERRDEVTQILRDWISESEGVLGEGDLNRLLRNHPAVEARHVKLWLASAGALRRLLHAGAYRRSEALLEETRQALPRYVQTEAFLEARRTLHQHRVVVIAGPPGVGKTTLARLLMLDGLEQEYQPIDIPQGGLSDAWDLMDPADRQLFFYDDFLGRIAAAPGQEDDEMLMRFIRRVSRSNTTRMVLTTREYILRQAQRLSDVLERESSDFHRYLLHVDRYSRREKARIFYNHIYFSPQVDATARRALLADRQYRQIIDHRNYSPRLIEWMTGLAGEDLDDDAREHYPAYCLRILRHPGRLWQRAYESGLQEPDRVLLLAVASLPDLVNLDALETAFNAACQARGIDTHGRQFLKSLKVLDDSFVAIRRSGDKIFVAPQNPSLLDFLTGYVRSSRADAEVILAGAVYLEQVLWMWQLLAGGRTRERVPPIDLIPVFSSAFERTIDAPPLAPKLASIAVLAADSVRLTTEQGRLEMMQSYLERYPPLAKVVGPEWFADRVSAWADGIKVDPGIVRKLEFVEKLAQQKLLDPITVITRLKTELTSISDSTVRWPAVALAHDIAPGVFEADEWRVLREEVNADLDAMLSEASAYFEEVSEVEDLTIAAERMGVDVEDETYVAAVEAVEEAAAERAVPDEDYEPDHDHEAFLDVRGETEEDGDIDAMFDRLVA